MKEDRNPMIVRARSTLIMSEMGAEDCEASKAPEPEIEKEMHSLSCYVTCISMHQHDNDRQHGDAVSAPICWDEQVHTLVGAMGWWGCGPYCIVIPERWF
jgi:hypothetical protein